MARAPEASSGPLDRRVRWPACCFGAEDPGVDPVEPERLFTEGKVLDRELVLRRVHHVVEGLLTGGEHLVERATGEPSGDVGVYVPGRSGSGLR
jgi:hypothetical protein